MSFKKITSITVLLLCGMLLIQTSVFAIDNYASWAAPYIQQADALGLLTENARKDYVKALTREEFCELIVTMYEKRVGGQVNIPSNPFSDTANPLILKAYSLGIVSGTSATTFSPGNAVTREQAAVMLVNAVRKMEEVRGVKIYTKYVDKLPFQDNNQISSWALESMKVAYANGLMQGDGVNVRPLANISCQECIVLILNVYNKEEAVPQDVGWTPPATTTPPTTTTPPATTTPPTTGGSQTTSGSVKVTVDGGNIPLKINETTQLSYTLSSDDKVTGVTWASSANSVATIDQNGNVKAIGKGNAKMTLTVKIDTKTYTASKTIYVDPPLVALNSVTIADPVKTVKYGNSTTFNVQLSPSTATVDSVTWSSSNTDAATIDAKGKITTKAAGTTTIKASVKAKDGTVKEATATLTVTAPVTITSIKFANGSSDPMFVGTTRTITATIGPSGAIADSKTWSSSNPSVASISSAGKISAVSAGTATITLETADRSGAKFSNSFELTVKDNYVSSFSLARDVYDIQIGETIYPELILSPPTAVIKSVTLSFSSSPTGIATTSSTARSVTGQKEGTGILTVKVTFEDKTSHTAQATINVLPMPIESVKLDIYRSVLKVNGKYSSDATTHITYKITPSTASLESIEFSSSDTSVATVDNSTSKYTSGSRKVQAVGEGNCTIYMTVRFKDGSTRTESINITVISG